MCLQELKLPFTFLSGHIHELRIHVPWTKLGSEPVVITINTMECILKLKDGAQVSAQTHWLVGDVGSDHFRIMAESIYMSIYVVDINRGMFLF